MTTKVKLRQKPISENRQSLYLDFYPPIPHPKTGKPTRREFLGLHIFDKPKTQTEKQHNKDTLQTAEQIQLKWSNQLSKPEIYTGYEKEQLRIKAISEKDFMAYFKELASKKNVGSLEMWNTTYIYLEKYTSGKLTFADLTEKFCNDFKEYLLTTNSTRSNKARLAQNSAANYFNFFKASIRQAYKDGYLQTDLNVRIASIKKTETRRNYLTIEELNRLIKTDCKNPTLKRAALFSALTGLRSSDIVKLTWSEVEYIENYGYYLKFTQQKTKGIETMPISEQAYNLLGDRKEPTAKVFEGLVYSSHENIHLAKWIGLAGIERHVTFHCFRHTYATLQVTAGTDLYTVSEMLGHKDTKTTKGYAKIVNEKKRETTNKIHLDFD